MKNKLLKKMFFVAIMLTGSVIFAQTVSGTVSDESGPLPGASVVVKGTTNGVTTDFGGNYTIDNVSSNAVFVVSFLGYETQEINVAGQSKVDVTLVAGSEALEEVVVTALGITREKKALGYAVTQLDSDEVNTVKSANVAESLVGKVAGVVVNESGGLGSGSRVVIRGNNSLTGVNQALIVVDGIPIDASGNSSGGGVYSSNVTGGGISDINSQDIESMTILKGPNAAALYGSRAANGVILITTKKGTRDNGLGVSVNSNLMIGNAMFTPDYQNSYGQGNNGAAPSDIPSMGSSSWGAKLDGSQQLYYTGEQKAYSAQSSNVEDFFETSVQAINSLSLDKGGEDYSMRFSYTNNNTTSIMPGSNLKSNNFNLRTTFDLSDKLSFDGKATYFSQELDHRVNLGSEGTLAYVYGMPRNVALNDLRKFQMDDPAIYDIANEESDYDVISYAGQNKATGNPYWIQHHDISSERRGRFLGFAKLDYEFNDWLSAFVRVGGDVTNVRADRVSQVGYHFSRFGSLNHSTRKNTEFNADFAFLANKDLTDKLNLNALVGGNLSERTSESMSVSGSQFKIPTRAFYANTNIQSAGHSPVSTKKVNSLYASASFAWDNFLYLDLTGRNDWSSTLGEDNRSYFYPSVNLAALIDRFIDPDKKVFNFLKVRGSWANVGNDTGVYQINQTYGVQSQGYLGLTTVSAGSVKYNPDLKPENVASSEFGIEARMLKSRLYFDFSMYKINTTDMIFDVPVTAATGFSEFRENIGEIENTGIEFLIGGVPVKTEKLTWDASLNFSKNDNKLVELIDGLEDFGLNSNNSGTLAIRAQVGGGIGDIYGTVWKTDDAGNRLVNAEGRPLASESLEYLGNSAPEWIGGFTNTFTHKNLSLRFLIDGRFGGQIYSATSAGLDGSGVSERTLKYRESGVVVDAINEDTGVANTESISSQQYWQSYSGIADHYVYDQTNVRLREFALTYVLKKDIANKIGMNSASVGLIGRNLFFIFKEADDIDPDATLGTNLGGQGISSNNVPTVRSLGLNINLKF